RPAGMSLVSDVLRRVDAVLVFIDMKGYYLVWCLPATHVRLVPDRAADGGAGRLLAGVDRRAGRADAHRLEGGAAGDRGVVAIAVVRESVVNGEGGGGGVGRLVRIQGGRSDNQLS